ncbi:MAG: nucleoside 2-deoxyribosyltransferase [archaeon]
MQKDPMYSRRIYLASPLFSISEQFWNEIVADELRKAGYEVFNPQSDNTANDKDNPNAKVTAKTIFDGDTNEVLKADAIVANLDGLTIDPGLAAECGIMWKLNKSHNLHHKGIIGYRSDIRKYGKGDQRFYFNQYVVGLIEDCGKIVDLNPPENKLDLDLYRREAKKIVDELNNLFN